MPRFLYQELCSLDHSFALDMVKKLEASEAIALRYLDFDFEEGKSAGEKILKLVRLYDADLLSAEITRNENYDGIRIINLNLLTGSVKPPHLRGEFLSIKIQRPGKEERQGVGYLEDGTMVVVNGGGDHIGETIRASVLSVKPTTAGKIIFCNALDHIS